MLMVKLYKAYFNYFLQQLWLEEIYSDVHSLHIAIKCRVWKQIWGGY